MIASLLAIPAALFAVHYKPALAEQQVLGAAPSPCFESQMSAFDLVAGQSTLSTSPLASLLLPRITDMNATAGEQWEFDCTSDDGTQGLLMGFYRDAAYTFLGPGALRVSLDVVWQNGTTWSLADYAETSTIRECDGQVTGTWRKAAHMYRFTLASDATSALVEIDTPSVQGSFRTRSVAPPRYLDGSSFPSETSSTQSAPWLYWAEPIPAGDSQVHMFIDGSPLQWQGMGGHMRFWGPHSWFDSMTQWKAFRARVGPFALSCWMAFSRVDGLVYPTVHLSRRGETLFSSQTLLAEDRAAGVSAAETTGGDYFTYVPSSSPGSVSGGLANNATGYELELVSTLHNKRWKFTLEHHNLEFEFALRSGQGGSAFVGHASGGLVGGKRYHGPFFNEQVDISDLWIPRVFMKAATVYHRLGASIWGF